VKPACNQIENHAMLAQTALVRFCQDQGVAVVGFSPLGAASYVGIGLAEAREDTLSHPAIQAIAAATGRTAAQVLLRAQLQRGIVVIPKSTSPERLAENLHLGDFELDDAQMAAIAALDCNRRFNDPAVYAKGWGAPGSWLAEHGYPLYA
jgi:D-xylose reductase